MYLVFFGSNRGLVRDEATSYINKNMAEGSTLTTLEGSQYQAGQVADALGANSLFGGEEWFVIDGPSDNTECVEELKATLKELGESSNTFVILEGALLAPAKKAYGKYAADIQEYTADKVERFNAFGLAEALATKDKRKLWLLLQEARLSGLREEEIVGMLWWQLKALRLAKLTRSADEAGMKSFPYDKAKRALSKFTEGEVEKLAQSLLGLYHDGHAGMRDMDVALEEWALTI